MAFNEATDKYSNIVNNALYSLLIAEFPRMVVVYQPEFRPQDIARGLEYIRFFMGSDEVVENGTQTNTRAYNYNVGLYFSYFGDQQKKLLQKRVSKLYNKFYYLMMSKRHLELPSGYKWHHAEINTVSELTYGIDEQNMDVAHLDIEMTIYRSNQFEIAEEILVIEEITIE